MQYRTDKYGNSLSVLGFGCMRFPRKMGKIDTKETEKQLLAAIEQGVNYFDTAYIYPGSESVLGEILERHGLRDKVYLATKLPHYMISSREQMEKRFQEQLSRLRTHRIDYYLMHMLNDVATWQALVDMGILDWLEEKKKEGAISQVGFSYHGNSDMFCQLLEVYDWDFCQIQYNYMDEHSQAGRRGLQYAHQLGLPVIIMEPLRGGKLVKALPRSVKDMFAKHPRGDSPAAWALRWLWDQKEVTVVLSGMNSMEMLQENLNTAHTTQVGSLSSADQAFLQQVLAGIQENTKVGCTGCRYCLPCPQHVDIPGIFSAYNRRYTEGKVAGLKDYVMCTGLRKNATFASQCIGCGKCEKHCPQGLPIRQHLKEAQKELEGPLTRSFCALAKRFVRF